VSRGDLEVWRDQTNVAFSLRMFPGGHFFLNTTQPALLQVLPKNCAETDENRHVKAHHQ